MEIRWRASAITSGLYAAFRSASGQPPPDDALAAVLSSATEQLAATAVAWNWPLDELLDRLIPLSSGIDEPLSLADVALHKTLGDSTAAASAALARVLRALEQAYLGCLPTVVDDLALRAQPLRDQWEARGPGLLAGCGRLTTPELLVTAAEIVLVLPVLGGAGVPYPLYNLVAFEAVLTNVSPAVPEVVRLAWLLAQLNLDLPSLAEPLPVRQSLELGRLALVPVVLTAAEDVELARCDLATVQAAIDAWQLSGVTPELLLSWWETYRGQRPQWPVAIAALGALLAASDRPDDATPGDAGD